MIFQGRCAIITKGLHFRNVYETNVGILPPDGGRGTGISEKSRLFYGLRQEERQGGQECLEAERMGTPRVKID